jgi:hypothetical protein
MGMRKLFVIIAVAALAGCNLFWNPEEYSWTSDEQFAQPIEIFDWINTNIHPADDSVEAYGIFEYWPLPDEVYSIREAECKGMAILSIYWLKQKLDIDSNFVAIQYSYDNKTYKHVVMEINGQILDPYNMAWRQTYSESMKIYGAYTVLWKLDYNDVMIKAHQHHY